MLADFSFTPPEQIFEQLKKGGNMSSMAGAAPPTSAPAMAGMGHAGEPIAPMSGMAMGGGAGFERCQIRRVPGGDAALSDPEVVKVEPGGCVLLRESSTAPR